MALGDDEVILGDGLPADSVVFTADRPARSRRLRSRKLLGGPRLSTMLLMAVWVAVLVLYLQVRPSG
ncbi:hypothetical protein [Nocardia sp. NPDC051570]|uniref:hypothetical protein n=1 Tax=Nocardia sp. NPDC051570 TaxID=3364324 RepID=UPI0037B3C6EE